MKQVTAPIISKSEVLPGVYLVWLKSPQIASSARPGQFVMVRCGEDCLLRRPLGIHELGNDKTELALLFTVVGRGTHWLAQRQTGDSLDLLGPLGNGYRMHPGPHNLLLVAGGIGIAPLCFTAQEALRQGCSVTLLLGAPTAAQLYPAHLLPAETKVFTATEDGTAGKRGMVTELLPDFTDWSDQVLTCGPPDMYHDMYAQRENLLKARPTQVSLEVRMGCGLGICYACTVKTKQGLKQVCKDGPVFDLDDVLWNELNC